MDVISVLLRQQRAAPAGNGRTRRTSGGLARRAEDRPTGATAVLDLQRTAGNRAVLAAVDRRPDRPLALQRQPKPGPAPPKWVVDAQQELGTMFPNDPLMAKVVVKDYAKLNATLQGAPFSAWTQSRTEIYIKDLSGLADPTQPKTAKWPALVARYVLHHEAEHIRQFAKAGSGPPTTWLAMLTFEDAAYTSDLAWLASAAGKKLIPDATLRQQLLTSARSSRGEVRAAMKKGAATRGSAAAKDKARFDEMKKLNLIPANADPDPTKLYQQPP